MFSKMCTVFAKMSFLCGHSHQFIKCAWFAWWVVMGGDPPELKPHPQL